MTMMMEMKTTFIVGTHNSGKLMMMMMMMVVAVVVMMMNVILTLTIKLLNLRMGWDGWD